MVQPMHVKQGLFFIGGWGRIEMEANVIRHDFIDQYEIAWNCEFPYNRTCV